MDWGKLLGGIALELIPEVFKALYALLTGKDPLVELAKERVEDIVPDPLRSELALLRRTKDALVVAKAREIHAALTAGIASEKRAAIDLGVTRKPARDEIASDACRTCAGTGIAWQAWRPDAVPEPCAACGGAGRVP